MNHLLMRLKVVAQEEEVEKEVHSDIDAPDQKEVCAACAAGELFVCCVCCWRLESCLCAAEELLR